MERGDHVLRQHRREFRHQHPAHADRYAIAEEFIDVVRALWDSWDDDAFPRNKTAGIYADPSKLQVLDHKGTYYFGEGPAQHLASAAGPPDHRADRLVGAGQQLAARTADVVFTAQQTLTARGRSIAS